MCGIIGTIISSNAKEQLHKLESYLYNQQNRGLKGLGFVNCRNFQRIRGETILDVMGWRAYKFYNGVKMGDAVFLHHRLPTTSKNTEKAAHPFINEDKTIVLMHNGTITNADEIKEKLVKKGHVFESEEKQDNKLVYTDSEVILHQLEENLKKNDGDIKSSFGDLLDQLTGGFAIAVYFKELKGEIFLFSKTNPITVSVGENGEFYFSSEFDNIDYGNYTNGLIKHKLVKKLEFGELGRLTKNGYEMLKKFELKQKYPITYPNNYKTYATHNYNSHPQSSNSYGKGTEEFNKRMKYYARRFLENIDYTKMKDFWQLYSEVEGDLVDYCHLRLTERNCDKLRTYCVNWLKGNRKKAWLRLESTSTLEYYEYDFDNICEESLEELASY